MHQQTLLHHDMVPLVVLSKDTAGDPWVGVLVEERSHGGSVRLPQLVYLHVPVAAADVAAAGGSWRMLAPDRQQVLTQPQVWVQVDGPRPMWQQICGSEIPDRWLPTS